MGAARPHDRLNFGKFVGIDDRIDLDIDDLVLRLALSPTLSGYIEAVPTDVGLARQDLVNCANTPAASRLGAYPSNVEIVRNLPGPHGSVFSPEARQPEHEPHRLQLHGIGLDALLDPDASLFRGDNTISERRT